MSLLSSPGWNVLTFPLHIYQHIANAKGIVERRIFGIGRPFFAFFFFAEIS
jgi:hypothetical protein